MITLRIFLAWCTSYVNKDGGLCPLVLFRLNTVVELGPCTAVLISLLDFIYKNHSMFQTDFEKALKLVTYIL